MVYKKNDDDLTLEVVKTINNFGKDFKELIHVDGVLEKLIDLVKQDDTDFEMKCSAMYTCH